MLRRRATVFVAALALLLAQAVGLAHAVAHPQSVAFAHAGHHGHDHGDGLFDAQHEEGSQQCQLLDQLAHADGVAAPPVVWTFAAPEAHFAATPAAAARATCACGYHARGPPSFLA